METKTDSSFPDINYCCVIIFMQLFEIKFTLDLGLWPPKGHLGKKENEDAWSVYLPQALQSCPEDSKGLKCMNCPLPLLVDVVKSRFYDAIWNRKKQREHRRVAY